MEPTLEAFKIELNAPKWKIKKMLDWKEMMESLMKEMMDKAYSQVCDFIQEEEPDAPREYIEQFARVFIEIRLATEYDIRKKEYVVIATPRFKEVNELNMDEVEALPFPDW